MSIEFIGMACALGLSAMGSAFGAGFAAQASVEATILSGMIRYSAWSSHIGPSTVTVSVPSPVILPPSRRR